MSRKRKRRQTEPFHLSSVNTLALVPTDPSFPAGLLWFPSVLPHTFTRPSRYFRIGPLTPSSSNATDVSARLLSKICPALPMSVCISFHNLGLTERCNKTLVCEVSVYAWYACHLQAKYAISIAPAKKNRLGENLKNAASLNTIILKGIWSWGMWTSDDAQEIVLEYKYSDPGLSLSRFLAQPQTAALAQRTLIHAKCYLEVSTRSPLGVHMRFEVSDGPRLTAKFSARLVLQAWTWKLRRGNGDTATWSEVFPRHFIQSVVWEKTNTASKITK